MMPHEPVRDVMRRTMQNLYFVEAHKGPDGPFEVTQLVNSFLGALAHPWETYQTELSSMPLNQAVALGWPQIAKERLRGRDPKSLGDLVRLMRNAIAHGNIEFLPGTAGDVRALRIWNIDSSGRWTWGASVSVGDMRIFLARFVDLAEQLGEKHVGTALRTA
jgi:hypothetical protein